MDIKLPKLGEGADSGTVVNVLVKEGDAIRKEQPLIELESEKAIATIPATGSGTVQKVHVQPGQKISAGQLLVTLTGAEPAPAASPASATATGSALTAAPVGKPAASNRASGSPDTSGISLEPVPEGMPMPAAAPSVRFVAAQLGLDLRRVVAVTGGTRVSTGDLRRYLETLQKLAARPGEGTPPAVRPPTATPSRPAESIDFSQWGPVVKKPLTPLRQVIARRMTEHWQTIPHVTQFDSVDMTRLLALQRQAREAGGASDVKLTVTPFILKAVVATLKRHPLFNASLDEAAGELVLKDYYHLGIAVDTEAGLHVPVIRDVDSKNIVTLSRELADLATRARERKLTADEMKGGTFSVSNQGAFGGGHFTPIVNKPEVAILGLGRTTDQPVVRDRQVEIRPMLPVALSYDHRVIDGGSAARFMVDLVKTLETFDGVTASVL